MTARVLPRVALVLSLLAAVLSPVRAFAATTPCAGESSFDDDGYADLAIGIPGETLGGEPSAGAVSVIYGTNDGLGTKDQFWHQDVAGVRGATEPGDAFGAAVAKGDFDGDGRADLAVGAPDEDGGAGLVHILYGADAGLGTGDSQRIGQSISGIPGSAEPGDHLGAALAAGDFDADGRDDLAIGVPGESFRGAGQAGLVIVLEGRSTGLARSTARTIAQGSNDVPGAPEDYERFGSALAACDFDGDGDFDLAIGSDESYGDVSLAGKVNVLDGPALDGPGQVLSQSRRESGDHFGSALAAGDFDGDGSGDLAVGAPGEGVDGNHDQGMVHVYAGAAGGDLALRSTWHQGMSAVLGAGSPYEHLGFALAAGDFDASGGDDLAIGVPGDYNGEGSVALLFGDDQNGISATDDVLYTQDLPTVPGGGERGDHWGSAVAMVQSDGEQAAATLVVGAAGENIASVDDGAVTVIYGGGGGSELYHQNIEGIVNAAERNDLFGFAVG